jgi:hypothetical protein
MRQDKTEVVGRTRWITHVTGPEPISLAWPEADNPQLGLLDEDAA